MFKRMEVMFQEGSVGCFVLLRRYGCTRRGPRSFIPSLCALESQRDEMEASARRGEKQMDGAYVSQQEAMIMRSERICCRITTEMRGVTVKGYWKLCTWSFLT